MALPQKYAPITWECDGSNRSFSVTWPFFEADDIVVTYITESKAEVQLKRGGDYKVTGGKDGNGMPAVGVIETSAIYERGALIRVERQTTISQDEAFANGAFPAKRIERALDRAMMALEELAHGREATEEIRVPAGSAPVTRFIEPQRHATADVESLVRGILKGQADQTQAAQRDLAQNIAALRRQVDGLHSTAPVIQPIDRPEPQPPAEPDETPATMEEAVQRAYDELNREAARQRAKFATPGKGLVYSQKQNEARAAIDDPSPELAQKHPETGEPIRKYPHLEAMIGIWVPQNPDLAEAIRGAAIFVLGRAADFKEASARIERQIDLAKQRIAQATTIADVLSVPASILWDQP